MERKSMTGWLLPAFFATAALIPATFGTFRAGELIWHHDFALRFAADAVDRLPLLVHVVGSVGFLLLALLQVWTRFRRRHPRLHRRLGRWAAPAGIAGGLAGVWMTLAHPGISGPLLYGGRLAAGGLMAAFIVLALAALRRRDFAAHGRMMIRAFALALPAGTLAFILLPVVLITGNEENTLLTEVIQVAAWVVHLGVAEWVLRRRTRPLALPRPATLPA